MSETNTAAFTPDDVQRCRSRAEDMEALIDNDGPDMWFYEEMRAWEALADKIQAVMDEPK